jgi:hypothetical protein
MSEQTGLAVTSIYKRRRNLANKGVLLNTVPSTAAAAGASECFAWGAEKTHFARRRGYKVENGTVIIASDAHWLPDHRSTGLDALIEVVRMLKPELIVLNGDMLDGGTISRWDPTRGHHKRFGLREELDCLKANTEAIQEAAGKAFLAYTLGNHDLRLSRYIAVHAPEALDLPNTRLEDWIPKWPLSWTVEVNPGGPGMTVIRHKNQPGMLHLQSSRAGCHYVHGHLHKLNINRQATFQGIRYSIDTGSLADPLSDAFDYTEGNFDHQQGFAVLTYRNGRLMPPDLCEIVDGVAWFRGREI